MGPCFSHIKEQNSPALSMALDLEARIEISMIMLDICSSKIRGDGEEISITEVKYSGYCFLSDKEVVFQRSPRLDLVVLLVLVMCKNHPGGTGFECMKLSCRAGEAWHH